MESTRRRAFTGLAVAAALGLLWLAAPEVYTGTFSDIGTFLRVAGLGFVLAAWVFVIRRWLPGPAALRRAVAVGPVVVIVGSLLWPYLRPPTKVDEAFPPTQFVTTDDAEPEVLGETETPTPIGAEPITSEAAATEPPSTPAPTPAADDLEGAASPTPDTAAFAPPAEATATAVPTPTTETVSPSSTPAPTATAEPDRAGATPTPEPTTGPTTTAEPTATAVPTSTPAPTATPPPTATPTPSPSPTPAATATPEPTPTPAAPVELRRGSFQGLTGHRGSGSAVLYDLGDRDLLRFENVDIGSGPALFVYLVPGADRRDLGGAIYVAPLTAEQGNQNYELPAGVDLRSGTWTVLVWCETFTVEVANATWF